MRLHQLAVTAFGPFAGTERVDFDDLASAGLFLLRGATGAGKSSVLDAVCYALYGEVPGARRGNPLRSDHAEPAVLTEVELELTLGGQRLRIVRRPEQQRPKLRGSGTTTAKPETLLSEWADDTGAGEPGWRALSKSHQEAGEQIHRLVGMSREQFCQVVLLPQGDFARFLRADTTERAKLLRQLFDTGRFEQVERWLTEQRLRHEGAVKDGRQRLHSLATRAEEAAGAAAEPLADWVPEGAGAEEFLGWAAILRTDAAERAAVAAAALAAAETAHGAAQQALQRAGELADRQDRHRAAVLDAARLAGTAEQYHRDRDRLATAQQAATVEPVLRHRAAAATDLAAAEQAERRTRAALAGAALPEPGDASPADSADTDTDADRLAEQERRLRAELGRLDAARADERRLAQAVREREQVGHELARAEELADEAADWLVDFDGRFKALQERQAEAHAAETRVEQLDARRTELRDRLGAAVERDGLRGRIATAERELTELRTAAADARELGLDLRERRLAGMAAELAAQLGRGTPCRVCGSAEHPAPARAAGGLVRAEDEERAHAAQLRAEHRRDGAEQALLQLRVGEARAAGTAGDRSAAELRTALAEADRQHREALGSADSLGQLGRQIDQLTAEQAARQAHQQDAAQRTAVLTTRLTALTAQQQELADRIAAVLGGAPSAAARAAELGALADAVAAAVAATRARGEAAARLAAAERESAEVSRSAGFGSPAEAGAALLPAADRAALQHRLDGARAEREAVEGRLGAPELVDAAARPAVDLTAVQQAYRWATDRLREASAADSTARQRAGSLARLGRQLAELAVALGPELEQYERIKRLAELAAGSSSENALRMRLESYVLAARLEQVAAAASGRLVRMSGGRYTLVHSDGRASGNRRSGLALRVVDAWTGLDRDTATLSGGESFFASLALALGLADVVTDESGGMPLDTLFIDEGFGSLDEQALEEVLDVLDGLRERDRAVGIVSHVADLRSRVPAQLLVHKGRHGSTLRLADREHH
ncbi:SMC family ATPase [Kitasatospora sp. NPDC002040]|uniref:SMC family ATPase n=1 Tax=Kitasatospora sp. NPDC002040 TaxID=3154661 RepID=UPI00331EA738